MVQPEALPAAPQEDQALPQAHEVLALEKQLAKEDIEMLQAVVQGPLPLPAVLLETQQEQYEQLLETYHGLQRDPRRFQVQSVLETLQVAPRGQEVNDRTELLLEVVRDYHSELVAYNKEAGPLLDNLVQLVQEKLTLQPSQRPAVREFLLAPPPLGPENYPEGVRLQAETVHQRWHSNAAAISELVNADDQQYKALVPTVRYNWDMYQEELVSYTRNRKEVGNELFIAGLGFPLDMSSEEIEEFVTDVSQPNMPPEQGPNADPGQQEGIMKTYQELERSRLAITSTLQFNREFGVTPNIREKFVEYLLSRDYYERVVHQQPSTMSTWALYMGVVANELGEEAAEGIWRVDKGVPYFRFEEFKNLNFPQRQSLINGWQEVTKALQAKGVPTQRLGAVLNTLNTTPLGPKFLRELLAVESPVTVLLWGYFMHTSEDKFKASMQFGSFIAMSNVSNKVMSAADAALARMGIASKIPGHPAVKFAVAMAAAYMAADEIQQLATWMDEKVWPDSNTKHAVGTGLSLISGDVLINHGSEALEAMGVTEVDPARSFEEFITRENYLLDEERWTMGRRYYQDITTWNSRVDTAIAGIENPITKKLWELEKITDHGAWAARMSVRLYNQVSTLRNLEEDLGTQLTTRGVLKDARELNAVALAIDDTADERNDRIVNNAFGSGAFEKVRVYMEGGAVFGAQIDDQDPIASSWKEYRSTVEGVAKSISVYKHLGLYAEGVSRERWFGTSEEIAKNRLPQQVQQGLIEEIAYRAKRSELTSHHAYPDLNEEEFSRNLARTVRYRDNHAVLGTWLMGIDTRPNAEAALGLVQAAYADGSGLDDATMRKILRPVQAAVIRNETLSPQQLRELRTTVSRSITAEVTKFADLKPMTQQLAQTFKLPGASVGLTQGDLPGTVQLPDGSSYEPLARLAFSEGASADLVLVRGSVGHAAHVEKMSFSCPSANREEWQVETSGAQFSTHFADPHGIGKQAVASTRYDKTVTQSFPDWIKKHPELAYQLETNFSDIEATHVALKHFEQQQAAQRERANRAERVRRRIESARNVHQVFTETSDPDETVKQYMKGYSNGAAIFTVDTLAKAPQNGIEFQFIRLGVKEPQRVKLRSDTQIQQLPAEQRRAMEDMLVTPTLSGEYALERLIALFPGTQPNRQTLIDQLRLLYLQSSTVEGRRTLLRTCHQALRDTKEITATTIPTILQSIRRHQKHYAVMPLPPHMALQSGLQKVHQEHQYQRAAQWLRYRGRLLFALPQPSAVQDFPDKMKEKGVSQAVYDRYAQLRLDGNKLKHNQVVLEFMRSTLLSQLQRGIPPGVVEQERAHYENLTNTYLRNLELYNQILRNHSKTITAFQSRHPDVA